MHFQNGGRIPCNFTLDAHLMNSKQLFLTIIGKCEQINKCMALRVIKQIVDKKVEVYYEHILKLTNNLQH